MPRTKKKQKINNLIVISDLHCGCQFGLCDTVVTVDGGGRYYSSSIQQDIKSKWAEFWYQWVPLVTKGDPFAVVCNGDAVDGSHHGSTTQISHNLTDQAKIAKEILKPIVEACEGRYYHIRGTEAHVGQSGQEEERLAMELCAVPDAEGRHARWELWIEVGTGLVHLSHHIGTSGSLAYETSAVHKELEQAFVEAARWGNRHPDVIVRSHRHRNVETRIQTAHGFATACTTAGWQAKMLALDTPLPTPKGWTTMGDVKVGDTLFDERGDTCTVKAALPIDFKPDSYEVRFSNGESVKACADHLWLTTACVDRPGVPGHGGQIRPLTRIRTTKEIYDTLLYGKHNDHNHKLDMPSPIQLPDKNLPIDPYVLGCWLGDGDSDAGRLTCHASDISHFEREFRAANYQLSPQTQRSGKCPRFAIRVLSEDTSSTVSKVDSNNFQRVLRQNNLLGNKHISADYLRASYLQRLSLLQGLMDTDGSADLYGRACSFSTSNQAIRDGISELLASLGIKYTVVKKSSVLNGKNVGVHWLVRFFISPDIMPVFRMSRKACRIPIASSRKTAQKSRVVHIVSVEPCCPVPMRCIAVDSPSRLYRFGKTMLYTHNTPFVYKIAGGRQSLPQIGGTLVRAGDEDIFTRHRLWNLARPKTEVVYG